MTHAKPIAGDERFLYIDGLRGIAALMVAISHLLGAAATRHPDILPQAVVWLGDFGRYGVQIFFVLSGFVIAHSVRDGVYGFNYLGRFAARRFVRLDLPYWSVIALEIFLLSISGLVMAGYDRPLPSAGQIVSNAFYVQVFLGYEHILPIFWTLCYEVQFYLVFVLGLVLLAKLQPDGSGTRYWRGAGSVLISVSFTLSLLVYVGALPNPLEGLFFDRWYQFCLGVLTYGMYRQLCSWRAIALSVGACLLAAVLLAEDSYRYTSLMFTAGTSLAILFSFRNALWRQPLVTRPIQFLGRISYSLYLLHPAIGWRAVVVCQEVLGTAYNTLTAMLSFLVGMIASIIASWMMYRLIEHPAIRLSKKVWLPKRTDGASTSPGSPLRAPAQTPGPTSP